MLDNIVQGVQNFLHLGGHPEVPPQVEDAYAKADKATRARTLANPRTTTAIRQYLVNKYGG